MGRNAAMEQWQGRHQRHFLLRDEPVECRRAQTAAPGGDVHLGGLVRLLPGAVPARRHSERFSQQLASAPSSERAARRRHSRREKRHHSRMGGRAADAIQGRTREEFRGYARRGEAPPNARRYYAERTAEFENIGAPLLSAGNWGGMGLHTRGNFEGWSRAGSRQKWLEVHGDTHFTHFYSKYGEALQKKFFGHFLKGEDTGWTRQPRVSLNIRHPGEKFVLRAENEWPLARTRWTRYFLQPDGMRLGPEQPLQSASLSYDTTGDGLTFSTPALT